MPIIHKNKSKFLLAPFLLFSAATHCMKMETKNITSSIIVKPTTMKELQKKRNLLKFMLISYDTKLYGLPEQKDSKNAQDANVLTNAMMRYAAQETMAGSIFLRYIYYYNDQIVSHNHRRDRFTLDNLYFNNTILLAQCKKARLQECSALGVITIALYLTFEEKKELVQKFLDYKFKFIPTPEDKNLALAEKLGRCAPLYIKKIWPLHCAIDIPEIPHDLIQYISLFMFEKEELLF